jgi:hypothetical protein
VLEAINQVLKVALRLDLLQNEVLALCNHEELDGEVESVVIIVRQLECPRIVFHERPFIMNTLEWDGFRQGWDYDVFYPEIHLAMLFNFVNQFIMDHPIFVKNHLHEFNVVSADLDQLLGAFVVKAVVSQVYTMQQTSLVL